MRGDSFGIVTPQTMKGTSLQKDRGTNAGTIVNGHPLDIKNNTDILLFVWHRRRNFLMLSHGKPCFCILKTIE